ncbi:hypothetical protein ACKVWC_005196 [Pyricularia oryzae]
MADTAVSPPAPSASFDNTSGWFNFTMWTAQHIPYLNMTKIAPSIEDIVLAGPRMVMKLGRFGSVFSVTDAVDGFGQQVIADTTTESSIVFAATTTPRAGAYVANTATMSAAVAAAAAESVLAGQETNTALPAASSRFSLEGARGLGSVFSYATSKWALCCIAMAVVLNRTHIFAATRRRLRLRWPVRFGLRIVPIILFLFQAKRLLQSIQCQTSPEFAEMRWGDATKSSEMMFSQPNTFLHGLSAALLFGPSDQESCLAVHMIPSPDPEGRASSQLRGSLSLLWPLFGSFCLSHFLETISCAVQGRHLAAETGMTLFEHSLAFAEADAAISNQLGWGMFTNTAAAAAASSGNINADIAITRSMLLRRANTPPEVLLVAFLSAMSHVTSHLLGIFNLQHKARLLSTGFFAACFMGSIIWSAVTFSLDDPTGQSLLRFPTVCIIGYIPHVLVLAGIWICFSIYVVALFLTALSPPDVSTTADDPVDADDGWPQSLMGRLRRAHDNMQANISLSDIRLTMEMDFYTALLRAGFAAISMASEAVYLNEDRRVNLARRTWLEDDRLREMEQLRMQWLPGSRYDFNGAIGLVPIEQSQNGGELVPQWGGSGYARERAAQQVAKTKTGERVRPMRDGVGAAERSGRWLLAVEFLARISRLVVTYSALVFCKLLSRIGINNPPSFLRYLAQQAKPPSVPNPREAGRSVVADNGRGVDGVRDSKGQVIGEWIRGQTGTAYIPRHESVDLEQIVAGQMPEEKDTSGIMYRWWLKGGWWGEVDRSGDYTPPVDHNDPDFDNTSIVSATDTDLMSEVQSQAGWDSDDDTWEDDLDDGQRTPTQRSHMATRESTPLVDNPMAVADLARLLNPRSPEETAEARALATHLEADGIVTRSRFARLSAQQRAQVLMPGGRDLRRHRLSQKMTPDEEAQLLEQILISRRGNNTQQQQRPGGASTWATGAPGLGPDGPQCVVCHSASRTVIVWPCRCLSLCDDCRVSLAMNNFDKCVCCRREVISFSRIFVP